MILEQTAVLAELVVAELEQEVADKMELMA
jgi:hypothetical protein